MSVMAHNGKIDPNESGWIRLHGKKLVWVMTFITNVIFIYMLILILSLYQMQEQTGKPINDKPITDSIQVEIDSLKKVNNSGRFITHVTLTTYNPVEAQCDSDPLVTADGTKIDLNKLKNGKIKYCAISRNLLPFIPLGSVIEIEGYGLYEVRDTMNKRFTHCIDILQHIDEKNFKKTKVKVVKIK
jgi:3D (Asp-Asp-Asp) domain-containing protein